MVICLSDWTVCFLSQGHFSLSSSMIVINLSNSSATFDFMLLDFKQGKENKYNKQQTDDEKKEKIDQHEFQKSLKPSLPVKIPHRQVLVDKQTRDQEAENQTQETPMNGTVQFRKSKKHQHGNKKKN